jgi:anti-anti-sigma factor
MTTHKHAGDLEVEVESTETAHVVRVVGELDLDTRERLDTVLAGLAKPPMIVVLDFSALTFVDSTGLKSLLVEHRRAREEGYEFVIAGAGPEVRNIFRVTALDITLPLADDVASVVG